MRLVLFAPLLCSAVISARGQARPASQYHVAIGAEAATARVTARPEMKSTTLALCNVVTVPGLPEGQLTLVRTAAAEEVDPAHGTKYVAEGTLTMPRGTRLRRVCITEARDPQPRFVTAYPVQPWKRSANSVAWCWSMICPSMVWRWAMWAPWFTVAETARR